jgi:NAD(P)-dependent dehydrogenase (short-subunit alcohol dehydrogenase family)
MVRSDRAAAEETAREIANVGGRSVLLVGDVADAAAVSNAVAECVDELGPVSTVIHAAAFRTHRPMLELTIEEWRRTLDVTLRGSYLLAHATLDGMVARGFGRYVLIGGSSAITGLPIGCAHVATAKSALRGFVRALSQEAGSHGVTANVVSPGMIATEERRAADPKLYSGWDPLKASVLGRMVYVEEVVRAAMFLCEVEAAAITGAVLAVDGGTFAFGD